MREFHAAHGIATGASILNVVAEGMPDAKSRRLRGYDDEGMRSWFGKLVDVWSHGARSFA